MTYYNMYDFVKPAVTAVTYFANGSFPFSINDRRCSSRANRVILRILASTSLAFLTVKHNNKLLFI